MILADTNVLLDLVTNDPIWFDWSRQRLAAAARSRELVINPVVFAELSVRFSRVEAVESALRGIGALMSTIPHTALFLAGKAFQRYRAAGGPKTGVLPDFFIGAHAVIAGAPLITRDTRRFRTYFPDIVLIAPDLH
jgi:predicted nucleic acid-binding protein